MVRRLGVLAIVMSAGLVCADTPSIKIDLAHGSEREQKTKETLAQVLAAYDLNKYTFTRRVVIEEKAVNQRSPQ